MSDFSPPSYWYGAGPNIAPLPINTNYGQQLNNQLAYVQSQAPTQQQLYGPGGFGAQTNAYSAAAAAYGRNTGGFGLLPSGAQAPADRIGTINNPGTSNPGYLDFGGGADQAWVTGGSQGPRPSESGGGIGSDAARAPNQPAIQSNIPWGGYNAARQYGWDANEGAPAPAAPQVYNRGEFNPHTYGWDHNEGAPVFGGQEDIDWYLGGSQGERPSSLAPGPGGIGSDAARVPAAVPQLPRQIPSPVDHPYSLGTPDWYNDMRPGGSEDEAWVRGGSQGARPSSGLVYGGSEDQAWVEGGSQGERPSTDVRADPRSPLTGLGYGGNRDTLAALLMRNASPQAPAYPTGQGIGKADRLPLFQGDIKAFGGQDDQNWVTGGSQGARPSSGLIYGGSEDQAWVQGGSQGDRPSISQGIGSDMRYGDQNALYAQPWHSLIPSDTPNTPEIIKQINYTAGRNRQDPAALAGVVNTESRWDPTRNFNSFFGATQMGPKTFQEAGGNLGGMNFNQYKAAPLERQIPAYGDWLAHYARPDNAAGLATSDIRSYPVPMQAAIMQGTQFAPNATRWPAAFAQGNTSLQTTPTRQAPFLSPETQGWRPTLNTMNAYYGGAIPR